jgi:hypothetical protein
MPRSGISLEFARKEKSASRCLTCAIFGKLEIFKSEKHRWCYGVNMLFKSKRNVTLLVSVLLLIFIIPNFSFAGNYDCTFSFYSQYEYFRLQDGHSLHISVPLSLYDYYRGKTHAISSDSDYSKFVTPDAVKPIAESIQNVTSDKRYNDEEFADAVLMLVHQIPYVESDVKYPVETIIDNSGDCDTLSLLAASIMKAGGLDVALFYYKDLRHVNVGVYLPYTPHLRLLSFPTYYEYNGKKYWTAEATSGGQWRLGDQPESLGNAKPVVIPLANTENSSPAHISSSVDAPLNQSSISINPASDDSNNNSTEQTLIISGAISPQFEGQSVLMYVSQDGTAYNAFRTETDNLGKYSFAWNITSTGTYYIRTSWSGASNYAGADSETLTVFVGFPKYTSYEGDGYTYIYGSSSNSAHELRIRQGVKEFINMNLSGTGVLLSGEFIILRSEQTIRPSGENITIPKRTITIGLYRRQQVTIELPERTTTIQIIPSGMTALRLPDNLLINNQFGFILQNNGEGNYSIDIKGLNNEDISQIVTQSEGNGTAFMDASTGIKDDTWYNVVTRMSEDEITAELYDTNGTLLKSTATINDTLSVTEFGLLLANSTDKIIAFKNLKTETLDQLNQPLEDNNTALKELTLLSPYIGLTILLAAVFATSVYVLKMRTQIDPQKKAAKEN